MTYEPGWVKPALLNASSSRRSRMVGRPLPPADSMARGWGWEDHCTAWGINDRAERERIRFLFIPRLRTAKFGQRTCGDNT